MEKSSLNTTECDWSEFPMETLLEIYRVASKAGINRLAIVGGAVRDSLLGNFKKYQSFEIPDIDLVVEGSAIELVEALIKALGPSRLRNYQFFRAYNTAKINLDGVPIDIATARKEIYSSPGENPQISISNLMHDLARRDFTINSIAVEIPTQKILDPYQGKVDLTRRELSLLHEKSVEEDPTRVIRGARYSARLNFELAPQTLSQVRKTIKLWPWNWHLEDPPNLAPPALSTRLRMELELLLEHEPWGIAIENLRSWGALVLLDSNLQTNPLLHRNLRWASKLSIPLLTVLVASAKDSVRLAQRLQLKEEQQQNIKKSRELESWLIANRSEATLDRLSPSDWCKLLEQGSWDPSSIALTICISAPKWKYLLRWWGRWRHIKSPISAKELIQDGWMEGPEIGAELMRLRMEMINNMANKKKHSLP